MLEVGDLLNAKYRIEKYLASGAMGSVYLATQIVLGRRVALKVLDVDSMRQLPEAKIKVLERRFFREASLCAKLNHPNIVTIFDFGVVEDIERKGLFFLAMEYLEGETLARRLAGKGVLPPSEAVNVIVEVCRGLREAHKQGVVHRDLKPENIMVLQGDAGTDAIKIMDFGLVKEIRGDASQNVTRDDVAVGTPLYMPPEQMMSKTPDPRSDIYSLGMIFYELLTGTVPFNLPTIPALLHAHLTQDLEPIRIRNPQVKVSRELEQLVDKMTKKVPNERYNSVEELLQALRALPEAGTDLTLPGGGAQASVTLNTTSQYLLRKRITRGNNTVVYEGVHAELGRDVVVKLFVPAHAGDEVQILRFLPNLALLRSPNIARLYDVGKATQNGQVIPFCVMELVRGDSLESKVDQLGNLTPDLAVDLCLQLLSALEEAHGLGIIHGGVNPQNILLMRVGQNLQVKVVGFHLVLPHDRARQSIAPPPPSPDDYLAPEIAGGGWPTVESDLFAAGKILRLCLFGPPPSIVTVPPALETIVNRATSPNAKDRYKTAKEFIQALREAVHLDDPTSNRSRANLMVAMSSTKIRGAKPNTLWVLSEDACTDCPALEKALSLLSPEADIVSISAERSKEILERLSRSTIDPPDVLIFGTSHCQPLNPILSKIQFYPSALKSLITTAPSIELLTSIANQTGVDLVLTIPCDPETLSSSISRLFHRQAQRRELAKRASKPSYGSV